jgi:glycerol-3-phosphate acyltransferase PlsY
VLFALDWRVGIAVLLVWLTVVVVSRFSSLGALAAALFAPAAVYFLLGAGPLLLATSLMCALLVWRHEGNIRKLLRGTESRIGEKKAAT